MDFDHSFSTSIERPLRLVNQIAILIDFYLVFYDMKIGQTPILRVILIITINWDFWSLWLYNKQIENNTLKNKGTFHLKFKIIIKNSIKSNNLIRCLINSCHLLYISLWHLLSGFFPSSTVDKNLRDVIFLTLLRDIIVAFKCKCWPLVTQSFHLFVFQNFPRSLLFQFSNYCLSITILTGT